MNWRIIYKLTAGVLFSLLIFRVSQKEAVYGHQRTNAGVKNVKHLEAEKPPIISRMYYLVAKKS